MFLFRDGRSAAGFEDGKAALKELCRALGECPEWQRGGTVNPLAYAFVGSSPTSPTTRDESSDEAWTPKKPDREPIATPLAWRV